MMVEREKYIKVRMWKAESSERHSIPASVMKKAIAGLQEKVELGRMFVFADDKPNLVSVAGLVVKMDTDDNGEVCGEVRMLDTHEGLRLQELTKQSRQKFSLMMRGSANSNFDDLKIGGVQWVC